MPSEASSIPSVATLLTGLAMGESPRWHGNRLWLCDWGGREVLMVEQWSNRRAIARSSFRAAATAEGLRPQVGHSVV